MIDNLPQDGDFVLLFGGAWHVATELQIARVGGSEISSAVVVQHFVCKLLSNILRVLQQLMKVRRLVVLHFQIELFPSVTRNNEILLEVRFRVKESMVIVEVISTLVQKWRAVDTQMSSSH